jgi:hypothetical protein
VSPLISVVAAVGGSLAFGVSAVVEQRGTKRAPRRAALAPILLLDLARQRLWLAGLAANLAGFVLQVVALNFGQLALVQPILICDLIFAVVISALQRRRWDPLILAAVVVCAVGISSFLFIARPSGGRSYVSLPAVLPLAAGLAVVLAGCLAVSRRSPQARSLGLALACGIDYGAAAFCVKLLTAGFSGGSAQVFSHWPVYGLAITGPLGFLLNQDAFQRGVLISPVLAVITACDPLVSIALAHFWLGERLNSSPTGIAGTVVSLLLMIAGIIVLTRHAPVAVRRLAEGTGSAEHTVTGPEAHGCG